MQTDNARIFKFFGTLIFIVLCVAIGQLCQLDIDTMKREEAREKAEKEANEKQKEQNVIPARSTTFENDPDLLNLPMGTALYYKSDHRFFGNVVDKDGFQVKILTADNDAIWYSRWFITQNYVTKK